MPAQARQLGPATSLPSRKNTCSKGAQVQSARLKRVSDGSLRSAASPTRCRLRVAGGAHLVALPLLPHALATPLCAVGRGVRRGEPVVVQGGMRGGRDHPESCRGSSLLLAAGCAMLSRLMSCVLLALGRPARDGRAPIATRQHGKQPCNLLLRGVQRARVQPQRGDFVHAEQDTARLRPPTHSLDYADYGLRGAPTHPLLLLSSATPRCLEREPRVCPAREPRGERPQSCAAEARGSALAREGRRCSSPLVPLGSLEPVVPSAVLTLCSTLTGGKGGDKKKPTSRSSRAGLQFPVGRIHRLLKVGR